MGYNIPAGREQITSSFPEPQENHHQEPPAQSVIRTRTDSERRSREMRIRDNDTQEQTVVKRQALQPAIKCVGGTESRVGMI